MTATVRLRWSPRKAALLVVLLLLFFVVAALCWQSSEPPEDNYRLLSRSCWFDADWQTDIRCAELHTPRASGGFVLPVVIIRNGTGISHPDPLVYLTGGPGASARLHSEGIKEWLAWLDYAALGRDLILLDPRGTGGSRPALHCDAFNRFNQRLLQLHLPLAQELEQQFLLTRDCFAALAQAPASGGVSLLPEHFGTRLSAMDVRALMAALDYPQWNLLGVSYGTRVALEIAHQEQLQHAHPEQEPARQPAHLRSLVLDSVYPAGYGGVQTWPPVLDAAFQQFFVQCQAQPECMQPLLAFTPQQPEALLPVIFMQVLERLAQTPQSLSVRRWDGEAPVEFLLNDHRFLSASFAAIYQPSAWPRITRAMAAAMGLSDSASPQSQLDARLRTHAQTQAQPLSLRQARDDLTALVEPFINNSLSSDFNSLTFMAVDCADNPMADGDAYLAEVAAYPLLAAYTRDQWRYQACHFLVPAYAKGHQPLALAQPQVPTLMLSGALDPITPPAWAGDLKQRWPALQWVVRERVAHAVLSDEPCVLASLVDFLDNPERVFQPCQQASSEKTPL